MKKLLSIAAFAFAISVGNAAAQRPVNPMQIGAPISSDLNGDSLLQVHAKHKKYKRYSKKHFRKYHRLYFYHPRYPYYDHRHSHNDYPELKKYEGLTLYERRLEDRLARKRLNQR